MRLSICIPAYYADGGCGIKHLTILLTSLAKQEFQDFEVVISDQSPVRNDQKHTEVALLTTKFLNLDIKYLRYTENMGNAVANLNNAIKHATGDIIRCFHQDDYCYTTDALDKYVAPYNDPNVKWVVGGFLHTKDYKNYYNAMIPMYSHETIYGVNRMGGISILSFRNGMGFEFDDRLKMMVDCDAYYRLNTLYHYPHVIPELLTGILHHEESITDNYDQQLLPREMFILKWKHKIWDLDL